jgi:hypothetical protein
MFYPKQYELIIQNKDTTNLLMVANIKRKFSLSDTKNEKTVTYRTS